MSESYRRGDMVLTALSGDYGKPRPAVIVQSDLFNEVHASLVLCPITSEASGLTLFRIHVPAGTGNGLRKDSEVMIDKIAAARRERVKRRIGRLSPDQMKAIDRALRLFLDLQINSSHASEHP